MLLINQTIGIIILSVVALMFIIVIGDKVYNWLKKKKRTKNKKKKEYSYNKDYETMSRYSNGISGTGGHSGTSSWRVEHDELMKLIRKMQDDINKGRL